MITETTTRTQDGQQIGQSERRLYTISELRDVDDRGFQKALEWVSERESEWWDGDGEMDYIKECFGYAGITIPEAPEFERKSGKAHRYEPSWDVSYHQGSMWFALPVTAGVDEKVFLRAMKQWYAGIDIRGKVYDAASDYGTLACHPRDKAVIDLRGRDARIMREQGFVIQVRDVWSRQSSELDDSYHYDDVSDTFKTQANEMLRDLCDYAAKVLRDDYESSTSNEEHLVATAEANEWLFTAEGACE